jgi:hypothetical protein
MPNDDRRDMVCLRQEVSMDLLAWKAIDPALEWNRWPRNIMTGHGVATKASGIGLDARLVAEVVAATFGQNGS